MSDIIIPEKSQIFNEIRDRLPMDHYINSNDPLDRFYLAQAEFNTALENVRKSSIPLKLAIYDINGDGYVTTI